MIRFTVALLGGLFALRCSGQTPPTRTEKEPVAKPTPVIPSPAKTPLLGQRISEAQRSEFFNFFGLAQIMDSPDPDHPGMQAKLFGTQGKFRGAISLLIQTKQSDGAITAAALVLRRDFLDGPTFPFACDAAKSFLELSPGAASPELARLRSEIWPVPSRANESSGAGPANDSARESRDGKASSSVAYLTFLGKQERCKILLPGARLILQNIKFAGHPVLMIDLRNEEK